MRKTDKLLVQLNNLVTRLRHPRFRPENLLILIPHCLQNSSCGQKVTLDIGECRECGKCLIKDLKKMAERFRIPMVVATGGELAVSRVKDREVRGIIAVACEKELRMGILASLPKPVLGLFNERPNGPCKDTRVDLVEVERAIEWFLIHAQESREDP